MCVISSKKLKFELILNAHRGDKENKMNLVILFKKYSFIFLFSIISGLRFPFPPLIQVPVPIFPLPQIHFSISLQKRLGLPRMSTEHGINYNAT